MLDRATLASRLADQLENSIREGRWRGKLPGTRVLAEVHRVSRDTVIAAVELLDQRGLLLPAETRKARRIHPDAAGRPSSAHSRDELRLLILQNAAGIPDHGDLLMLREMQNLWERYHGPATWAQADFRRYEKPEFPLETLVQRHSADALLLSSPPAPWSKAAIDLRPSYFCGGDLPPDRDVSMTAYNVMDQLRRVLSLLVSQGHHRILVPNNDINSLFTRAIVEILEEFLPRPERGTLADLSPCFAEARPEVWRTYWQREFARIRPTAVILFSVRHLLSLYSHCAAHGIRIPEQVSVVLMNHEEQLEWLSPRPVMLRYPRHMATRHFHEWIDGRLRPLGTRWLDLDILPGESLAPAG